MCSSDLPAPNGTDSTSSASRESLLNQALRILRADSCSSSESSLHDWENSTKKKRQKVCQQQNRLNTASTGLNQRDIPRHLTSNSRQTTRANEQGSNRSTPYENQYEVNKSSKQASWNTNGSQNTNSQTAGPQVLTNATSEVPRRSPPPWRRVGNKTPSSRDCPSTATADTGKRVSRIATSTSNSSIHENLKSTHLSQMNRELPISDVYHERKIGRAHV